MGSSPTAVLTVLFAASTSMGNGDDADQEYEFEDAASETAVLRAQRQQLVVWKLLLDATPLHSIARLGLTCALPSAFFMAQCWFWCWGVER